ncbi:MAG: DUF1653 domain-containing protein [Agathobacter sp.]|nr:DUF1653 domain-containing protein [Agathobacter sp.]
MNRRPAVGETYRHFKNKNYKIIAIAHHSETGEELVIYQALYGDGMVCARPLDMFVSEVDHEKYPEVTQKYRFEKIADAEEAASNFEKKEVKEKRLEEMTIEEKMMAFFDTEDLEARYKILLAMREEMTDTIIDNLAVVIDVVIPDGDITKRYDDLRKAIQTKQRYEQNTRLR